MSQHAWPCAVDVTTELFVTILITGPFIEEVECMTCEYTRFVWFAINICPNLTL